MPASLASISMNGLAAALSRALAADSRAVVVAVAHGAGSVPREAGAWMVVTASVLAGTIGGGHLEHEATRLAREALSGSTPAATWLVRFPLAARLGQCCGGVATIAFAVLERGAEWLDVALACERTAAAFALVHRLGATDATTRHLVVTADDSRGSVGDAGLDSAAVIASRARLAPGGTTGLAEVDGASLFIHVVRSNAFDVALFGNGHVGRALVHVLAALPCRVRWIDERESDFPAKVPANVVVVASDDPAGEIAEVPRGAYVVVTTHNHALDFAIVEAALERDDFAYIGLIGSKAKRAQFAKRIAARGSPDADLARVTCPIGASAGLTSKEPGAIAVGVAVELLAARERRMGSEATFPTNVRGIGSKRPGGGRG
ncbi:MAG: xanthine dehydrogenase accessory protein XdhC [Betaproteobacteria bacterium]